VQGDWRSCAIVDRTTRGARLEKALDAACDDREIAACRALAQRLSPADAAKARAVESYVRILEGCQQTNHVFCDVPSAGWRALVDTTAALSAATPKSSPALLPGPWQEVPPLRSSHEIVQLLQDAGVPRNDAGVFLLSSTGGLIELGFDPHVHTPEQGFADCLNRLNACFALNRQVDKCVETAPRCRGNKPWLGDPAGIDCCPQSCASEYFTARTHGKTEAIALDEMAISHCYPGL
jgi:hypothetical protein